MITVSIKFPLPLRYVQSLNECYHATEGEQTSNIVFPNPLRFIHTLQCCYGTSGTEHTATIALPKQLRYVQSLRGNYYRGGKEYTVTIVFAKPLICVLQLLYRSESQGHESPTTILFQKPLRYVQKLHHDDRTKESGYTEQLLLNRIKNYQHGKILYQYDTKQFNGTKLKFQYDYNNFIGTKLLFTFDWIRRVETKWLWKHSVLVHSGWKIMARDTVTGHVCELGFIDAENKEHRLTDVELPKGDYEIFVLTSSLFWKDCLDRNIRLLSIRNGKEVSSFPNIYHLRSSISQGMTVIEWSAYPCETNDCRFVIWYSPETPIDTTRQPDTTVVYYSSQIEYRTTFQQNAPAYVCIAAMRTGNEPEYDTFHELFLDWNTTPPRAPDDVLVLNPPLSAIDPNIEIAKQEYPNITLWG